MSNIFKGAFMKFMAVLIVVEDIKKSRHFYENVLGQTVKVDFGENITFIGDFAIHQKSHFQSLIENNNVIQKSNSCELYFEDNQLEPLVQKLKDLKIEFVHEIKEQPWKQKVIRFYDFDKNLIEVGESMEYVAFRLFEQNHSIEEISKTTYLNKDIVEAAIQKYSS